jgi:hypothetical protein
MQEKNKIWDREEIIRYVTDGPAIENGPDGYVLVSS